MRYMPRTLGSNLYTCAVYPFGGIHLANASGSRNALNTRSRGALKTRISRTVPVVGLVVVLVFVLVAVMVVPLPSTFSAMSFSMPSQKIRYCTIHENAAESGAALRAHRRTRPVCVCSRRPTSSSAPLSALDSAKGRAGGVEAKGNLSLPILA